MPRKALVLWACLFGLAASPACQRAQHDGGGQDGDGASTGGDDGDESPEGDGKSDADEDGGTSGDGGTSDGGTSGDGGTSDGGTSGDGGTSDDDNEGSDSGDGGTSDEDGDDGLGPPTFDDDDLDPPSNGGTITFQQIGAVGWYPSRRDPVTGPCDAYEADSCCMATQDVTSDLLTPWDEDLILTLRGPMRVKQLAVYQPQEMGDQWTMVSGWDERQHPQGTGLAFHGNGTESGFPGEVGTECLVDITTADPFQCGPGSVPYCPPSANEQHHGWRGSKLFVLLAAMPHVDGTDVGTPCSDGTDGNWWDAPWVGLSLGELMRAGAFSDCHCYAKNPAEWWLADGCGQFNAFEVVNDNNEFRNLDVFSTNFFGYAGYVGEGPCGAQCDASVLASDVDLIDKASNREASQGAEASPSQGPGAAFRRPAAGYRYILMLLDVPSRTVQLALVHPLRIPTALDSLLPGLPGALSNTSVDQVRQLRLPR